MLVIRLKRIGKKNKAQYRMIVQEKSRATASRFLEEVGLYNPHNDPGVVEIKEDRIKHWLSQGTQVSPTVHNILIKNKIIEGKPIPLGRPKKKAKQAEEEKPASVETIGSKEANKDEKALPAEPEKTAGTKEPKQKKEAREEKSEKKEIIAQKEFKKKSENQEGK